MNNDLASADLEPYSAKVVRWGGATPLPRKTRCRNTKITVQDVRTDKLGNILQMPILIGRPCFGIPTALLKEKFKAARFVPALGSRVKTGRCNRCSSSHACAAVVSERLKIIAQGDPVFNRDLFKWNDAGGLQAEGFERAVSILGQPFWEKFCNSIAKKEFTSSNATHVQQHWAKLAHAEDKRQQAQKRKELSAAWRNGDCWDELASRLDLLAHDRMLLLNEALDNSTAPFKRLPRVSVARICTTWWGREFCRLTGRKINPSAIATCLIEQGRNHGKSHNVLRDAVHTDLTYIDRLEAGVGIWPSVTLP